MTSTTSDDTQGSGLWEIDRSDGPARLVSTDDPARADVATLGAIGKLTDAEYDAFVERQRALERVDTTGKRTGPRRSSEAEALAKRPPNDPIDPAEIEVGDRILFTDQHVRVHPVTVTGVHEGAIVADGPRGGDIRLFEKTSGSWRHNTCRVSDFVRVIDGSSTAGDADAETGVDA